MSQSLNEQVKMLHPEGFSEDFSPHDSKLRLVAVKLGHTRSYAGAVSVAFAV